MKLWGRKSAPIPARPVLGRGFGMAGGEWPRAYEAQLRDGFVGNPVAQRAVRLVAEACGSAVVFAEGDAAAAGVVTGGVMEAAAMALLLHGNAFLQIVAGPDGRPAELCPLRPERVTVEVDARGWPIGWRYRVGESVTRIPADDGAGRPGGVHVRLGHPLDDHYGLGCLGAASGAIAIHNAATRWNKALLDNAARPSGAIVHEPAEAGAALSPAQFDRLKAELEASFSGAGNAGRPMLLEGGLRWQALGLTPQDMDFAGMKAAAAREIALAFGVPPMLLGLPGDNTYANYAEANRALWRQTVLPLCGRVLEGVAAGLAGWWPGVRLRVDLDQVPALAADRERLWRQVSGADFLSRAEKRVALGFAATEAGEAL